MPGAAPAASGGVKPAVLRLLSNMFGNLSLSRYTCTKSSSRRGRRPPRYRSRRLVCYAGRRNARPDEIDREEETRGLWAGRGPAARTVANDGCAAAST